MGLPDPVKMSQLRQVAEAVVKDNFLELFDLAARPQGGKTLLSVVLDKPSGRVGLQECEAVSRDLEKRLDELDVMEGILPAGGVLPRHGPAPAAGERLLPV